MTPCLVEGLILLRDQPMNRSQWKRLCRTTSCRRGHRAKLLEERQIIGQNPVFRDLAVGDAIGNEQLECDFLTGRRNIPHRAVVDAMHFSTHVHAISFSEEFVGFDPVAGEGGFRR